MKHKYHTTPLVSFAHILGAADVFEVDREYFLHAENSVILGRTFFSPNTRIVFGAHYEPFCLHGLQALNRRLKYRATFYKRVVSHIFEFVISVTDDTKANEH